MAKCQICKEEFDDDKSLHRHLRTHKMLLVDYYHKYYPRYDLYTGNLLKFKNKESYFENDFDNKIHLKRWLKDQSDDVARKYCVRLLSKRKKKLDLKYTPSEIELRSSMMPPTAYLNKIFDEGYYSFCKSQLDLISKFKSMPETLDVPYDLSESSFNVAEFTIYVDTREQRPLRFSSPIEVKTLSFGDYACSDSKLSSNIYIERKSLTDFIGTMSGGLERFKKEIERSREEGCKLVILIEEGINNALSFKHLPYVSKKIKATPEFIFHNVRGLCQDYDNIQFLFVKGRKEATRVIEKLFTYGSKYSQYDLQLAYDSKEL
tara:strand:+ start:12118 stop:13074 length:957 start_codon:yes stop_codon:yes gene_type:complete